MIKFLVYMLVDRIFMHSAASLLPAVRDIKEEPGFKEDFAGFVAVVIILSSLMAAVAGL